MSQGVPAQQPLFASASAQGQSDDFDLNEIFAEYFISEFENPVNAYTNSMGNYVAAPGNDASAGANTNNQNLVSTAGIMYSHNPGSTTAVSHPQPLQPSTGGGIRTPFHSTVAGTSTSHGTSLQQQLQTNAAMAALPMAKRPKLETGVNTAIAGAVSSRLGFNAGNQQGVPLAATIAQQQQQTSSGLALPIGRGIRLGGAGGVAPATAQKMTGVGGMIWGGPQVAGASSDQAVAERRQRNREHAKRSRVRKKFMLESLQQQVAALQRENQKLRMLVQDNIPEHAQLIISKCCTSSPLFADGTLNDDSQSSGKKGGNEVEKSTLVRSDFQLIDSLSAGQQNFVLSDPRLPDNPIVFATPGFYKLTGYTAEQVLGRNCRFLQGSGTDPKTVDIVRKAIQFGSDCTVCILNYKADGTPFWNQFFVAALRDSDNCIVNYVGVQTEIEPDAGANALEDRVNSVMPLANKEDDENEKKIKAIEKY